MGRPIFQKTLIYYRENEATPFFHETDENWLPRFKAEIAIISPAIELKSGHQGKHIFFIALLFPDLELERPFSQAFYVEGGVKRAFKQSMVFAKSNRIAFSMSNINLDRLESYDKSFLGYRVMTCDIKPDAQARFFDALPEKRKTVPLLYEILAMRNTLSCSGYYDFTDSVKHVQTLYTVPNEGVLDEVRQLLAKYPEHGSIREEYNRANGIICLRDRGEREMLPFRQYLEEIADRIPEDLRQGLDTPLYL